MDFDIKRNRHLHFAVIGVGAIAALLGYRYPLANLVFRVALSLIAFAVVLYVPREYLKAPWLLGRVLPLLALHCALIVAFLRVVEQLNIWIWGVMVIAECASVSVIVIGGLPKERAYRNAEK